MFDSSDEAYDGYFGYSKKFLMYRESIKIGKIIFLDQFPNNDKKKLSKFNGQKFSSRRIPQLSWTADHLTSEDGAD